MQRLTSKLARFRALSPTEQRTYLSAMALLPLFWVALRLLGLPRLQSRQRRKPRPHSNPLPVGEIMRLASLVNSAARHAPGPATCLSRSLYLWWLLRRRGVDSQLRIGVRLAQGVLDAHAWVEYAGVPVNDRHNVGADFAAFTAPLSPSRALLP